VGGDGANLMAFDADQQTVYQIRSQHGNEQVRELIPSDESRDSGDGLLLQL
jgi:hypothetical protein